MNVNMQLLKWYKLKVSLSAVGKGVSLNECRRKLVGSNPVSTIFFFISYLILKLPFFLNYCKPLFCVLSVNN
jgi:hypothetical protein